MSELLNLLYVYIVVGILIQVLLYKRMSYQIGIMANGSRSSYVAIVVMFVVGWPVVLLKMNQNK